MSVLTIAERRAFQQLCGADGRMLTIAADQRGSMRKLLADDAAAQSAISDTQLGVVKADIVRHLARHAPSVLLDPMCAVPHVVADGTLPRDVALLVGIDATGHGTSESGHYLSRLVPGITARRVRELGGTAGKLLIYLRSDYPADSAPNLAVLKGALADFAAEDMLLVVEFLSYRLPDEDKVDYERKLPAILAGNAELCLAAGSKVLKMPYPGSADACKAMTALCKSVPWALLSAGVDHATFLSQVENGMTPGAAGVIAGRSLWKDCVSLEPGVTARRFTEYAVPRLKEIQAVLAKHAA